MLLSIPLYFKSCIGKLSVSFNMKSKPYKVKVSISLDEDIINTIKELAENDDRSFSQYINVVLKEHIEKHNITYKK